MTVRHDAIAVGKEKMGAVLQDSLEKVNGIWHRIGFSEDVRQERMESVISSFQCFVDRTLEGEENLEKELQDNVIKFSDELHDLCTELKAPQVSIDSKLPLIDREQELRAHAHSLRRERKSRIDKWIDLVEKHRILCSRLAVQSPYAKDQIKQGEENFCSAPTLEKLEILQTDVDGKDRLVSERSNYLEAMRKTIRDQYKRMRVTPTTQFEIKLLDNQEIPLTDSTMETLDTLEKDLSVKLQQYLLRVQEEIELSRDEIQRLWDDCCISEKERQSFPFLDDDSFSEELLERHRLEVDRLQVIYDSNRDIYDRVKEWKELFFKMVAAEERANDPARFTNRGGALLKEEKDRKAVLKRLPEVEAELAQFVFRWEEQTGEKVFIAGRPFLEYIATEKLEFDQRKEREKLEKQQRKQAQKQEHLFGSSSRSPSKNSMRRS